MLTADRLIIRMRIDFVITEMWLKIGSAQHIINSLSLSVCLSFVFRQSVFVDQSCLELTSLKSQPPNQWDHRLSPRTHSFTLSVSEKPHYSSIFLTPRQNVQVSALDHLLNEVFMLYHRTVL